MPDANTDSAPLPLHQVLEEEYERLNQQPPPRRARSFAAARADDRLADVFADIHEKKHAALCLSGGGIRSATFALGVLQGLARRGLLDQFHYLSTVSGGGYVGGWLSAWIHRHLHGVSGVMGALRVSPEKILAPEPEPVLHLRSYSNYLTPRLGFLSADTWTLAGIILRNLILNWLVLFPLMLAVLVVPRFAVALARLVPPPSVAQWVLGAALFVGFVCGVTAVAYVGIKRPSMARDDNDWRGFLRWCLAPLAVAAFALTFYWAWLNNPAFTRDAGAWPPAFYSSLPPGRLWAFLLERSWAPFVFFGLMLYLAGWLAYSFVHDRFSFKPGWRERMNWHLFGEFVMTALSGAAGGLFLWLVATKFFGDPQNNVLTYVTFAPASFLALFFVTSTLFAGISSEYTSDDDREWWARFSGWLLIATAAWAAVGLLVLIGPQVLSEWWGGVLLPVVAPAGGLIGLVTTYLAKSARSPAQEKQERKTGGGRLLGYALPLGALVFLALLVVLLSMATNYLLALVTLVLRASGAAWGWLLAEDAISGWTLSGVVHGEAIRTGSLPLLALFLAATAGLGLFVFSRLINTNKFSQHAMYRNRLIRAYLGASNKYRDANRFTGFDAGDNVPMHHLRPEVFHLGSFVNIGQFAMRLRQPTHAIHRDFRQALSADTLKHLDDLAPGRSAPRVLQLALVRDLNGDNFLYKKDSIFDDFPGFRLDIALPPRTAEMHGRSVKGGLRPDEMMLLNRRLIEAAFPEDIYPCPEPPQRPLHVVNMALNLVRGTNLAWQDRKAESFTVSPLHCGSCQIPDYEDDEDESGAPVKRPVYGSYRRSREYGGKDTGGISLGTAVAVSGAAVSPNMGYYSSPLVTFLMTLFNVRLGWWLGNPGKAGERGGTKYYQLANPKSSAYPIVAEALGLTDDENNYVYLSDGGHFENLGLYEMVLRRNSLIVVSDASDDFDFKFDNLGNAIRKIRIDFGIPVEFDAMHIYPRAAGHGGAFCAVGRVEYSRVDRVEGTDAEGRPVEIPAPDGAIIYIKPVFYGASEPRDIYHYAHANDRFPHESTVDQWFSEEQFESYRSLGMYIVGRIAGDRDTDTTDAPPLTLAEFRRRAEAHVAHYQNQAKAHDARPAFEDLNAVLRAFAASLGQNAPPAPARTESGDGFTG